MKRLAAILLAAFAFVVSARAQKTPANPLGGNLTVQDAGTCSTTGSFLWQQLPSNASTTTVNLAGTFSGTLTIRLSNNGGGTWTTNTTVTTASTTSVATNGFTDICADVTTFASGSFGVTITTGLNTGPPGPPGSGGITITTVSGLSSISGKKNGTFATVTDGSTATDCVTGGGTNSVNCQYNGSSWAQAVAASSGSTAWSAITAAANTNTGFSLAPTATGTVPWTHNCPTGITVDCFDWELNAVKEMWLDSAGLLHLAQSPAFSITGNAAGFTGSLAGDATGTQGATTVVKVNGAAVPASAPLLGTNSSSQPISVTTIPTSTVPAFTGDVTNSAGSLATTVGKINGTAFPTSATVVGSNGSAQPIAAVTTGSGITVVLATSPALVTPNLGTPSAATLTNATGYPTVHTMDFQFGTPGGTAISTGILGYATIPIGCTLTAWYIEVDSGTATVKTLKVASGTAIPTLASNSISTNGVAISSGTVIQSTTLTDFTTTTFTAKDIVAADLITVSGVGYIDFQLVLSCTQ